MSLITISLIKSSLFFYFNDTLKASCDTIKHIYIDKKLHILNHRHFSITYPP